MSAHPSNIRRRYLGAYNLIHSQTPGQTLGPFFHQGLLRENGPFTNRLEFDRSEGRRVSIQGRVLDGLGRPVGDALIEIWQANSAGAYAHPLDPGSAAFRGERDGCGFGRTATNSAGEYLFQTVLPGAVPGQQGAPHINAIVGARGMMRHAFTRIYFEHEPKLDEDIVYQSVPRERRSTLVAVQQSGGTYRFDIHLQGPQETVFFDV